MATETRLAPTKRVWGDALTITTTATYLSPPPGARSVLLYCASAFTYQFCPPLKAAFHYDLSELAYSEIGSALRDRSASTVATLNSFAGHDAHDYLYFGSDEPFAGVYIDVTNTNSTASVLSGVYYNGTTWASASITDGTTSGGATLAQDGAIAFTPAADWAKTTVNGQTLYWLRLEATATLDSSVTVQGAVLIDDGAWADGYADAAVPVEFGISTEECGGIMALHGSSATLHVTWKR